MTLQTDLRYALRDSLRDYLTLAQVAAELPPARDGKPHHVQTIRNWIVEGRKVPGGRIVHLNGARFPRGWMVLRKDLQTFLDELTAAYRGVEDPSGPTPAAPAPASQA